MTKEEIRISHLNKNGLAVTLSPVGKKINKATYDAMEEYARIQSIAFAEWMGKQKFRYHISNNTWVNKIDDGYSPEQLYNLFLIHQSQQSK